MHRRARTISLLLLAACPRSTATPDTTPPTAVVAVAPAIDGAWMRAFVERFADDTMAGRYTLDPDAIGRAADTIAGEYERLAVAKVDAAYRVPFEFGFGTTVDRAHHLWVEASGPARPLAADQSVTLSEAAETTVVADVVFAGTRGRTKVPASVRDHIVLVRDPDGAATPPDHADLRALAGRLAAKGARALLVVGTRTPHADVTPWPMPVVALPVAAAESIAAGAGTSLAKLAAVRDTAVLADVRLSLAPRRTDKLEQADNVLAWIPGTDAAAEIVVLGAHYDHIGTAEVGLMCRGPGDDAICNGADDNASGTAMVLAIARALRTSGYRPRRSIVFVHFAGEELGLHGSKALANHLPVAAPFDGGKIVAMVNFDMVGRLGDDGLWIGGVGSSSAWMPLLLGVGDRGIPTVYERSVTSRSDHASFYEHDIPVLFFFTGLHADYHKPGDEVAAMNFDGMHEIGAIALGLTVALGDGAAIPFTAPAQGEGLVGRMPGSDARTVEQPGAPH